MPHDVTLALEELSRGNPEAAENLLPGVFTDNYATWPIRVFPTNRAAARE